MIEAETRSNCTVLRINEKRLDAQRAPGFKAAAEPLLDGAHNRVVIDAAQIEFVDSTGLGAIVSLLKQMGPAGELAVAAPSPAVRKLFTITRLDRVIKLYDSLDDATRD